MVAPSDTTYVIGHRNPDTDAICAAIGYASLLQRLGRSEVEAACCGPINQRTAYVLDRAGVPAPRLLTDVRLTAGDICRRDPVVASTSDTFLEVYQKMTSRSLRAIPIVEPDGTLAGIPTLVDLLQLLLPTGELRSQARRLRAALGNIVKTLDGSLEGSALDDESAEEPLVLVVGASSVETMRERMSKVPARQVVVATGDRPQVQRLAIEQGVRCLIITGGFAIDAHLLNAARRNGVSVIRCRHDTASAAQLLRFAREVGGILTDRFLSFSNATPVAKVVERVRDSVQPVFPVIDSDSEQLLGVLTKSDLIDPPRRKLILVDHNEFSQAVAGVEEAEILEIVDHHRLSGDLVSRDPVRFINEPVGSTSTIVTHFHRQHGIEPTAAIATCLIAGIISDTLQLTSPTATERDREALGWLVSLARLDLEAFAQGFFNCGSLLKTLPPREAVESDRKEFHENRWRISISQIEELGLDEFWRARDAVGEALAAVCEEGGYDFACLMVTDVTRNHSVLLTTGDARVESEIGYHPRESRLFDMPGVVSRKKQLFPYLSSILRRLPKG